MEKPKLLLDVCCGPCSTHAISQLKERYEVILLYDNSNIFPRDEYEKRLLESRKVAKYYGVELFELPYNHQMWEKFIAGFENEKEGGHRCELCFAFRFENAARFASERGFSFFASTLTVSPFKSYDKISIIGKQTGKRHNVSFLDFNFKKENGFSKSIELSKELGLYRQNYCGCEYSLKSSIASPSE